MLFSIDHPELGTLKLWLLPAPDLCDVGLSLSRQTSWLAAPFVKIALRRRLQAFDEAACAYFRDEVEKSLTDLVRLGRHLRVEDLRRKLTPEVRGELRALPRRAGEQLGRS
jgi:hypothetical protein